MASSTRISLLSFVFTLFHLLSCAYSSKDNTHTTITVPLTSTFTGKQSAQPFAFLRDQIASASPHIKKSIFRRGYKAHVATLSFGTPPQKLSYLVDTGSDVVWAPCGRYTCSNCTIPASKFPKFNPRLSSSSKILGCTHPRCNTGCPSCNGNSKNCSHACQRYSLVYGTGAERGYYLLENLIFPGKAFRNFVFGCTDLGIGETNTDGLAGFGQSAMSLPVQMGVKKFAYCLNSHVYDGTGKTGKLIFDYSDAETPGLSYTPFLKGPPESSDYYYVGVKYMVLGNKLLRIPSKYLAPGAQGKGGVILDSGTSFGYMAAPVFKIVTDELKRQMSMYSRSPDVETITGYALCFNYSGHKSIKIPDLIYHFMGGAKMVVPGKNYFDFVGEVKAACFPFFTDSGSSSLQFTPGPSIILGNSQHVDYYSEYDLKNKRFGFRQQIC